MSKTFIIGLGIFLCGQAFAEPLITLKEASLPEASGTLSTRGIARGPGVKLVSPDSGQTISSPFDLKLAFQARGDGKIDSDSVKIYYLKANPVDLTDRLKKGISKEGLEFLKAEVPPGKHTLRVTVKDIEGHETNSLITLLVEK